MTQDQTPSLRFPEFRGAGAWAVKKLGEVCEINPSTKKLPEDFFYIDLGAVNSGNLISKKKLHCDSAPSRAQRLLKSGDIIYQVVRPYQRNNFLCNFDDKDNYVASTGYAQLRALDSNNFLYQLIHTDSFVNIVIAKCKGSNYPAISSSDLSEINISIPLLAEQEKIAECLLSLDEVIMAQGDRLDGLKDYKRGLMQQLFPADGQTTPTLRFPEFRGKDPWEVKRLAEVCDKTFSGGTPSTSKKDYYGGSIPFIRSAEIDKEKTELFLSEEGLANSSAKLIKKGDVLFALYGANSGNVAVAKLDGAINQAIICLQSKGKNQFIYQYLFYINSYIVSNYIQGGQGNLSGDIVKSIKIPQPPLAEQQKIAECLSSLDDLITGQEQKLKDLKHHKKGLMQQLFPKL